MPRKGHSQDQVLNKLRQVEVAVASGKSVEQAVHGRTATTRASTGNSGMNWCSPTDGEPVMCAGMANLARMPVNCSIQKSTRNRLDRWPVFLVCQRGTPPSVSSAPNVPQKCRPGWLVFSRGSHRTASSGRGRDALSQS